MTTIDPHIVAVFKSSPRQLLRVKLIFNVSSEHFMNNLIIAENYLKTFSAQVHSKLLSSDSRVIIDVTLEAFLCETLANNCISLSEIAC